MQTMMFTRPQLTKAALAAITLAILMLAGCSLPRSSGSAYGGGTSSGGHRH